MQTVRRRIPMTKSELRAAIAAKVKNLSPVYCRDADKAICRQVLQSQLYEKADTIFCYIGTDREINTMTLLRAALIEGKRVAIPFCTGKGIMEARQIRNLSDLVSGEYGILAPKLTCPLVAPEEIELAIIPCCTGNEKGQRLGYGGGYYDRYLPGTHCPRMLLCRRHLVTDDIPMEPYDVPMDYLVTEQGVMDCGQLHL